MTSTPRSVRTRTVTAAAMAVTAVLGIVAVPASATTTSGAATTATTATTTVPTARATSEATTRSGPVGRACPPTAVAVGFSDALDKATVDGVTVGGLSGLAVDRRSGGYVAVEDHSGTDPARLFFFRDRRHPRLTGLLTLRRADGTPYDASNFDGEGIAVLPDGDFLVSSETEPSIRIFDRSGTQTGALPVPARFAVAPAGAATANATLEGLSLSPSGRYVYAAMEGTLSTDRPATGEGRLRRILVYAATGGGFRLVRQLGYQVDAGNRISEVAAYADGRLLVLEAAFTAGVGNTATVYAVTDAAGAPDVSGVANLSAAPSRDIVAKRPVADLVRCPSLGATSKEPQTNPLLDNYEGLAVTVPGGTGAPAAPAAARVPAEITLISDDNFSPTQVTRLLTIAAPLP